MSRSRPRCGSVLRRAQWLSATQSEASVGQVGVVPPQQSIWRGDDSVCLRCKANTCDDHCFLLKPSVVKGKQKQQKSTPRRRVTSVKRYKKTLYIKADTNKSSANTRTRVCSGITGLCTESPGMVQFILTFFDESTGRKETLHNITAKIFDTPYDFIPGRPDIKKYNMLDRNMSQFRVKSNELEPLLTERDPLLKRLDAEQTLVQLLKLVARRSILSIARRSC